MARTQRRLIERFFPGSAGQRHRHIRFFLLAVGLGVLIAATMGLILYTLNTQGRL